MSRETAAMQAFLTSSFLGRGETWLPEFRLRGHVPPLSYGQLSALMAAPHYAKLALLPSALPPLLLLGR